MVEGLAGLLGKFLQTFKCFLPFRSKQLCLESYQSPTWPLKFCLGIQCLETIPFSSLLHTMPGAYPLSLFSSALCPCLLPCLSFLSWDLQFCTWNNDSFWKAVTSLGKSIFILGHTPDLAPSPHSSPSPNSLNSTCQGL